MSRAGPGRPPRVSVVVPVLNGGEAFRRCLEGIGALSPPPWEVVVVDDGSTDGSGNEARRRGMRVVRLPEPGGPARARNAGARGATGEIVLFVDADVVLPPDAVGRVTEAFRASADLAAVFGSYDDEPAEGNFLSQYKNLFHHYVHQTAREEASTFWAGCGAVRRDVFLGAGGFDERYRRPCIEDVELGYRLKAAGHRIRLLKDLQVKHLKRWDAASLLRADFLDRALPWTELILTRGGLVNDLNLTVSSRVSVGLAWALAASLAAAGRVPGLWIGSAALAAALMGLNAGLYRFFVRKRGPGFAAGCVPWHWGYLLYCGLAFGAGILRFRVPRPWRAGRPAGPGEG